MKRKQSREKYYSNLTKGILVLFFFLSFLLPLTSSALISFPNVIDTREEKINLQTVLNSVLSPSPNLTVDGVLGSRSTFAIKTFQTLKGLVADGVVGPATRSALMSAQGGTTTIPVVTTSTSVISFPNVIDTYQEKINLQTVLNKVLIPSPNLTVDGVLGSRSTLAIKTFQILKGLTSDGVVGPATRQALEKAQQTTTTTTTTTTVVSSGGGSSSHSSGGGGGSSSSSCSGSTSQSCTITNGSGTESRTCTSGSWSSYGTCTVSSCNTGYTQSGNTCIESTCSGSTTQSCTITNGTGSQARTCSLGSWSSYGTCTVVSCNSGYTQSGNTCVSSIATGNTYYVSNTGSDTNNGTSESTPWQTIAKVNASTFSPGDQILFKRGDTWREILIISSSGTLENYITFGNYGTGDKPRLYGSVKGTDWTEYGTNIWVSSNTFTDPYNLDYEGGLFIEQLDGSVTWGLFQKTSIDLLTSEYNWFYNTTDSKIYLYSPTNPTSRYNSVEISQRQNIVSLNDKNYLLFDGLDLRYSKISAFRETWPYKGITTGLEIKNCHISHIGIKGSDNGFGMLLYHSNSWVHSNVVHDCGRRTITFRTQDSDYYIEHYITDYKYTGGALAYRTNVGPLALSDILIENNTSYNGYHAQISVVSEEIGAHVSNVVIRNNFVYDDSTHSVDVVGAGVAPGYEGYNSGMMGFAGESTGVETFTNINVYNNILIGPTGYGLNLSYANNINFYNNLLYGLNLNAQNTFEGNIFIHNSSFKCNIKNNIIYNNYNSSVYNLRSCLYVESNSHDLDIDYNLYYTSDSNQVCWNISGLSSGKMSHFTEYQTYTGWDAHSLTPTDPLLVSPNLSSPESGAWSLSSTSPAIGAGINVGLSTDHEGDTWSNPPSIGAYEY